MKFLIIIAMLMASVDAKRGAGGRRMAQEKIAKANAAKIAPYLQAYGQAVEANYNAAIAVCTEPANLDNPPELNGYCRDVVNAVQLGTNTDELVKKLNYYYGDTFKRTSEIFGNMTDTAKSEVFCKCVKILRISLWTVFWSWLTK